MSAISDIARSLPAAPRESAFSLFLNRRLEWAMLAPATILLVCLTIYPIFNLGLMAGAQIRFEQAREIWTWALGDNFRHLLRDEIFRIALKNTLVFAILSVAIELVLGLGLAILVSSIHAFKGVFRSVLILPILLPPIAIGSMWKLMYSYDFGLLNQIVTGLGGPPVNWTGSTSYALLSVVAVDVWHWTPFVFLILFAAIEGLPKDVMEAARIDGASNMATIFRIIIPLAAPAIAVAALYRTIFAFKMFDQVFLLTSGGPGTSTEVVSLYLYKVYFQQNDLGYGAMLSLAVIAATVALLFVGRRAAGAVAGR